MPSILLVKTSSLGDVVHNLPVVSDIRRARPDAVIDWAVEEAFTAIPALHRGLRRVIACAPRRWRRNLWRPSTWGEIGDLRTVLRDGAYDTVIDTQGLLKSALIARQAPGVRHGLDWRSSREPLRWAYDRTYSVPWGRHAVERNRSLAAQVLGYTVDGPPDYGIEPPAFPPAEADDDSPLEEQRPWLEASQRFSWAPAGSLMVLLHGTSAERKLWPDHQWKKLAAHFGGAGIACLLPWGSAEEHDRSTRIAKDVPNAIVPPRLGLHTLAGLLGKARCVVGVDTGLVHLAAALGRPTVGIYVATDPAATGVYAGPHAADVGTGKEVPSMAMVLAAIGRVAT
ncbi:MAG: lipopolysaccharide heptosyltransferase I [Burkholderiales bacterium]|nr:lipopolysaccharide heptosyltransferase I [Burkholderiales bacterium]